MPSASKFREDAARLSSALTTLTVRVLVFVATIVGVAGLWALTVTSPRMGLGLVAVAGLGAAAFLLVQVDLAWTFSLAIAGSVLSGNAGLVGLPLSPDRIFFSFGVAMLAFRTGVRWLESGRERQLPPPNATQFFLLPLAIYAACSAAVAGTILSTNSFFQLLDRLGLVPFAMFAIAPMVFKTEAQRKVLLIVLTGLGAYLSLTAIFEILDLPAFVFPRYIADPNIGLHVGRARGPFLAATADGLAMYACAVASVVLALRADSWWARRIAQLVVGLCLLGCLLTLTRSVWLSTILATSVAMATSPVLRKYMIPALLLGAMSVGLAFATVPDLQGKADARASDQRPLWDRLNSDSGAIRALKKHPAFGVGWARYQAEADDYAVQAPNYPLTTSHLAIHNLPLSYATELGAIGFALWVAAFGLGVVRNSLTRRHRTPWTIALIALWVFWLSDSLFEPLTYAFPTLLLWTWAGIVQGDRDAIPSTRLAQDGRPATPPLISSDNSAIAVR